MAIKGVEWGKTQGSKAAKTGALKRNAVRVLALGLAAAPAIVESAHVLGSGVAWGR